MSALFGLNFNLIFEQWKSFYHQFVYNVEDDCSILYDPKDFSITVSPTVSKAPGTRIDLFLNNLTLMNLIPQIQGLKPKLEYTVTDYKERKIIFITPDSEEAIKEAKKLYKEHKRVFMVHGAFTANGIVTIGGIEKLPALSLLINPLLYIPWDVVGTDAEDITKVPADLQALIKLQELYCEGKIFVPATSTSTTVEVLTLPEMKIAPKEIQEKTREQLQQYIADESNTTKDVGFYQRFIHVKQASNGIIHGIDLFILQNTFNIERHAEKQA